MVTTPGFVIAATASGAGKTTIATGLMYALAQRMTVAPFKVGPDYIDPSYHSLATKTQGRNLDSVMCGRELIGPLYAHGCQGADIAVVEGVMGLFDGRITTEHSGSDYAEGSTADIAALLGLPIVLVVDVRGMSQSVGALVRGFSTYDPRLNIAGVILNNAGSSRHAEVCQQAIIDCGIPVFGVVPRIKDIAVPSRHLGLVTSGELTTAQEAVEKMGDIVEQYVDIDRIIECAQCQWEGEPWKPEDHIEAVARHARVRIALATGPAFSFTYAEHRELLAAAGAELMSFDPLRDDFPDCDGLIIPGGFPEEYCKELAQRSELAKQIRARIEQGMPVHAECAGLLWLLDTLDSYPMLGVIPAVATMKNRVTLGYRDSVALVDSCLYRAGQRVVGHEFHYTQLVVDAESRAHDSGDYNPAWAWRSWEKEVVKEGFIRGNIHASYVHVHPAAVPTAISRFVEQCLHYAACRDAVSDTA
ncbi:cobyrinate a,c-diamide synthase [Corynebacterium sp. sy017]|uniref:cobyrinate a,c-diamide synthase n=1 Tax=unclassified Corynebacterium TaxID=2624378 RepID=UPI0011872F55|nr:cobyrinate a,c-diamide synthase [Corynebacterium sp. SY003]MBP3087837.1 cobyrinate a,c-diamide synthase [Corynebacterium sp. sy017]TSD92380.1 cobyrinate a,c-diamide synthase [Corynebacterium sp. SY003]